MNPEIMAVIFKVYIIQAVLFQAAILSWLTWVIVWK